MRTTFSEGIKQGLSSYYTDRLVENFYDPLLSEAELYQRVSGYFSTAGIDLFIEGIEELAKNNGKMQFIISHNISEYDFKKIQKGYILYDEIKSLKIAQRNEKLNSKMQTQLGNLAFMIAMGKAKIKVAFTDTGLFHDKFGIITKGEDKVFFSGSANETFGGISSNYESITVDVSWDKSEMVQSRIDANSERFNRLWNNKEDRVEVVEISQLAYEQIAVYQENANIKKTDISEDTATLSIPEDDSIHFKLIDGRITRLDNSITQITHSDRLLKKQSDLGQYFEIDNTRIKIGTSYRSIQKIINTTIRRADRIEIKVFVSEAVEEFIARNKYSIEQYKILGNVYKDDINEFPLSKISEYKKFCEIVQSEVDRPLYDLHLRSAFYQYEMIKAANFSVPGSGKTAMILGVFAFLNRKDAPANEIIDKILVVAPISAFQSWKDEFYQVFKDKKQLQSIDSQSGIDFEEDLKLKWKVSNLVIINYESLKKYESQLQNLITHQTMLVFDEVHRVKNPEGVRSEAALNISKFPKFKYVLTGTPIPNSYKDIYNLLNILYSDEYTSYFGWELSTLENPKLREIKEINYALHPFFWRTNKKDLDVPNPDSDIFKAVEASKEQLDLSEAIYTNENTGFSRLIRLIQASTNPSLLNKSIDYNELMSYEDSDSNIISKTEFSKLLNKQENIESISYGDFDLDTMITPKFKEGINLIRNLVTEGKKVVVWGIFVDTLQKITSTLKKHGIATNLIYGATDTHIRNDLLNEFRKGDVQVLVTNPQTLGESISLHKEVHDAVYFEYNFNLTYMLQSRDRIHRLGLKPNQYTRYYFLQTKDEIETSSQYGYIDQKIYDRLKLKEKIMYDAIDGDNLSIIYTENEIQEAIDIVDKEKGRVLRNS